MPWAKYRKRPVVVEAIRWDGRDHTIYNIRMTSGGHSIKRDGGGMLHIDTLEGVMAAQHGDWIIRGIKGELYPIRRGIFEETYEAAVETRSRPTLYRPRRRMPLRLVALWLMLASLLAAMRDSRRWRR